jgi:hypothetical protein
VFGHVQFFLVGIGVFESNTASVWQMLQLQANNFEKTKFAKDGRKNRYKIVVEKLTNCNFSTQECKNLPSFPYYCSTPNFTQNQVG